MDSLQLLLASLLILIICLIVWLNNAINYVKQPRLIKWVALFAMFSTIYFYSRLEKNDINSILQISGGSLDDEKESLIIDLDRTPE